MLLDFGVAFEAADEVGLMLQPELPYYGDYPTEAFAFDPFRDLTELYRHYRRHVSFTTYSTGNEGIAGATATFCARLRTNVAQIFSK